MSIKLKKQNRGFSLVELMVVVAIMGTLSAIAIPAYNDYRRSAKKTAYRSDLSGLHKGWLAFGVENDDFCERETTPSNASIVNVGMSGLTTSKLYGNDAQIAARCSDGTSTTQTACAAASATWLPAVPAGNGPGKVNYIGFGDTSCPTSSSVTLADVIISDQGNVLSAEITGEEDCDLRVTGYEMGVVGHISGETWFGQSINHLGVLSVENQDTATDVDPQCA